MNISLENNPKSGLFLQYQADLHHSGFTCFWEATVFSKDLWQDFLG
jgi:hypothetical protein